MPGGPPRARVWRRAAAAGSWRRSWRRARLGAGGGQLVQGLADDLGARHAEEVLPRAIHAEIAAVGAFEEDRVRQGFEQLLGHTLRGGATGLAGPQIPRGAGGGGGAARARGAGGGGGGRGIARRPDFASERISPNNSALMTQPASMA